MNQESGIHNNFHHTVLPRTRSYTSIQIPASTRDVWLCGHREFWETELTLDVLPNCPTNT